MRRILVACLPALALVTAAACAAPDDGKGVASLGGAATPRPTSSLSLVEQAVRYARCMRQHGVPLRDPEVNGGSVRIYGVDRGLVDKGGVDADVLDRAQEACTSYRPVLPADEQARKRAGGLDYSRCMRAHGVEDFPDPDPDGRFSLPEEQTDPDYDRARATCRAQGQSARPTP
ncbi:hypothetical protein GCM10009530_48780 [Microbispora corallina]|uniref:Lipoprotein n=1 Tax=Microbispora corallina TaxID=83302 RepID=A0ABQ4G5V8_9ACTN|nr:hypothetical protein [Microbispora corallina]GIH42454.1 hypothetical protein Mco01_54540 [Microbispora corallina]